MFRFLIILLTGGLFTFVSCKSEPKLSDSETITENVKNYFFLEDSIEVNVEVVDTLHVEELNEMLDMVDQNLNLVGRDLDTLSLMIDDKSYKKLDFEKIVEESILLKKAKYQDSVDVMEKMIMRYQLAQASLSARQNSFKQTRRVLLHLKRSIWADIAGFDIAVTYTAGDVEYDLGLLLDANFNVVD